MPEPSRAPRHDELQPARGFRVVPIQQRAQNSPPGSEPLGSVLSISSREHQRARCRRSGCLANQSVSASAIALSRSSQPLIACIDAKS
jgi:hypothetical protein